MTVGLRVLPGVSLLGLSVQAHITMQVAQAVFNSRGHDCIVTCGSELDAIHSLAARHYSGDDVDFRTQHVSSVTEKYEIEAEILDRLASGKDFGDYEVRLEAVGTPNEHLHVGYRPRRRT